MTNFFIVISRNTVQVYKTCDWNKFLLELGVSISSIRINSIKRTLVRKKAEEIVTLVQFTVISVASSFRDGSTYLHTP